MPDEVNPEIPPVDGGETGSGQDPDAGTETPPVDGGETGSGQDPDAGTEIPPVDGGETGSGQDPDAGTETPPVDGGETGSGQDPDAGTETPPVDGGETGSGQDPDGSIPDPISEPHRPTTDMPVAGVSLVNEHNAVANFDTSDLTISRGISGAITLRNGSDVIELGQDVERIELRDGALSFGTATDEAFLARLYEGILGRSHDGEGISYWSNLIQNGMTKGEVADRFLSSLEGSARFSSIDLDQTVDLLYQNMLGRGSDEIGHQYYKTVLNSGSSFGDVAAGIADSAESQVNFSTETGHGIWVADTNYLNISSLYEGVLGRSGEQQGIDYWKGQLQSGATLGQLAEAFVSSDEFAVAHAHQTDEQFVEALYQNVLGRVADVEGLENWLQNLSGGSMNRADVAENFIVSSELNELNQPFMNGDHLWA
jgi:hypothetical protein